MNSVARAMTRALAESGSWLGRDDLQAAAGCSEARADDELAELVMAGTVLYNQRAREYRLAGGVLARVALRKLLGSDVPRQIIGKQSTDKQTYQIGLAVRTTGPDGQERLTVAELEMPYPHGDVQQLATALWAFGADLKGPAA